MPNACTPILVGVGSRSIMHSVYYAVSYVMQYRPEVFVSTGGIHQ